MANVTPEELERLYQFVDNIRSPVYAYHPSLVSSIIDDFIRHVRELPDAADPSYTDYHFSQLYRFLAEQPDDLRAGADILLHFAQNYSRLTRERHVQYARRELQVAHSDREHARGWLLSLFIICSRAQVTNNLADIKEAIDKHGAASERVRAAALMRADADLDMADVNLWGLASTGMADVRPIIDELDPTRYHPAPRRRNPSACYYPPYHCYRPRHRHARDRPDDTLINVDVFENGPRPVSVAPKTLNDEEVIVLCQTGKIAPYALEKILRPRRPNPSCPHFPCFANQDPRELARPDEGLRLLCVMGACCENVIGFMPFRSV
ncbi:hypothetical protein LXA43DRAFT_1097244 [Ganoderma leucocontextum]|nr:hypothetical protein LXA43DRAFT_1097244 [Ganoderma leucocontextum]